MACSVVCVSHTTGSGGEEVGKQIAERLGYLYVDEDIVARAAAAGGLDPGEIADEGRRRSFAGRLLDTLAQGGGDAWTLATTAAVAKVVAIAVMSRRVVMVEKVICCPFDVRPPAAVVVTPPFRTALKFRYGRR